MPKLASPRISALIQKLRQAEHAGQYFSSDDVAGFIAELRSVNDLVKGLEDGIAADRRGRPQTPPPPPPPMRPGAVPIGTFFFQPAAHERPHVGGRG